MKKCFAVLLVFLTIVLLAACSQREEALRGDESVFTIEVLQSFHSMEELEGHVLEIFETLEPKEILDMFTDEDKLLITVLGRFSYPLYIMRGGLLEDFMGRTISDQEFLNSKIKCP
ncbi:MAG: hypothetical protein FWC79_08660 [Oscillospiraceae bacterium]|nr:hypothetical protein [Oscillospiraceae bacterium]